jgi:hypothetical protein
MKVYIVVSGEYSEFGINKVFLDKSKAERYIELSKNRYDNYYIRTMETSDENIIEKITYVRASYEKNNKWGNNDVDIEILVTNTLNDNENDLNGNWFWLNTYSNTKELQIERVLYRDYDEEVKNKYTKACYDLMAKIESLISLEGWTEEMINDWLSQNVDKYLE